MKRRIYRCDDLQTDRLADGVDAVALVLGALQARRISLKRRLAELTNEDCLYDFNDDWLWPRPPTEVWIRYCHDADGLSWHNSQAFTSEQVDKHFKAMEAKLLDLGVETVWKSRLKLNVF